MLFLTVLMLQEYLWASTTKFQLMYQYHRYEFKNHACKLMSLMIANIFALFYAVLGFYSVTLVAACIHSEINLIQD